MLFDIFTLLILIILFKVNKDMIKKQTNTTWIIAHSLAISFACLGIVVSIISIVKHLI